MRRQSVGTGIYLERNGTFSVCVIVRDRQLWKKGFLTKAEAKKARIILLADAVRTKYGLTAQRFQEMTIDEAIDCLIDEKILFRIDHSKGYRISFTPTDTSCDNSSFVIIKNQLGELKISALDLKAVSGLIRSRRAARIKDSTIQTNYSVLCRLYDLFRQENMTDIDVRALGKIDWKLQPLGRIDSRSYIPPHIMQALIDAFAERMECDPKSYLFIHAAATGQRPKEIADLLMADIHLDDCHCEVRPERQKSKAIGARLIEENRNRWIDLPEWLIPHLRRYLALVKRDPNGPLFPARILPPKSPKWYSHDFGYRYAKLQKEKGWAERFTLYSFRHTCAKNLVRAELSRGEGADLAAIAEQLGHSVKMLIKRYLSAPTGRRLFGLGDRRLEKVVPLAAAGGSVR